MTSGDAERVKEQTDIVQLVGESISLKRAGQNFKGLCPFHQEKTPSFIVSPSRQSFHCFGCGKGGDCFTWMMEREGMTFPEALRVLASRAGIQLKFERHERSEERDRLRAALDMAADFYHAVLIKTPNGRNARNYLRERGITEESVMKWRIGFVPSASTPISRRAAERGISEQDLIRAGILGTGRRGAYERFYGRILFPLTDTHGSVVGFAGRVFEDTENKEIAKYVNSPETALYRKSSVLYGLAFARDAIRKEDNVVVVEGYTDVICSHQAGIAHVVATSGTALTEQHVGILKRYTNRITFAFDADAAGSMATRRAIDIAFAAGMDVSVITLPEGSDPADIAVRDPEEWKSCTRKYQDMFSFLLDRAVSRWDPSSVSGKKEIVQDLLPLVSRVPDGVVRGTFIQLLAGRIHVESRYLYEDLERLSQVEQDVVQDGSRRDSTGIEQDPLLSKEERLVSLLLTMPHLVPIVGNSISPEHVQGEQNRQLYRLLLEWYTGSHAESGDFCASLPTDLRKRADELMLAREVEEAEDPLEQPETDAAFLVRDILTFHLRKELRDATEKMQNASDEERGTILAHIKRIHRDLAQTGHITLS